MRVLKTIPLKGGFQLLPIHYTHAVEEGKTWGWAANERLRYPRPENFDREMEIDFGLKIGALAYPRFDEVRHTEKNLPYDPRRPLHLGFDFNVNPMSLVIDQEYTHLRRILVIKEFVYGPTTIDSVVSSFRDRYNEHRSDVIVYGDATKGTNAQTAKSNWDIVRLSFRGYHIEPQYKVPLGNPFQSDRVNAVNRMLSSPDWQILIDPDACPELILDLSTVIMQPDSKKIFKVSDPDDPYSLRTHASDAWGYRIFRAFPVVAEAMAMAQRKREPLQPGRLLGEVQMGTEKEELERRIKGVKRKPFKVTPL